MFKGPVYTVLYPSFYLSHPWWKGLGLWKQNMSFSSSSPEELEISLELRPRQGLAILNSCVWVVYSAGLVRMNAIALPTEQTFSAVKSSSCGSFPFSACYMVWWLCYSVSNVFLHHLLHTQDLCHSRSNIYALKAWDGCLISLKMQIGAEGSKCA